MNNDVQKSTNSITCLGLPNSGPECLGIRRRLELLKNKCPPDAKINLEFEKRKSSVVGKLMITAPPLRYCSKKVAHNSHQTYLLLEEDIEEQLLKWRRYQFSQNLARSLQTA